jgi:hypothetical protein
MDAASKRLFTYREVDRMRIPNSKEMNRGVVTYAKRAIKMSEVTALLSSVSIDISSASNGTPRINTYRDNRRQNVRRMGPSTGRKGDVDAVNGRLLRLFPISEYEDAIPLEPQTEKSMSASDVVIISIEKGDGVVNMERTGIADGDATAAPPPTIPSTTPTLQVIQRTVTTSEDRKLIRNIVSEDSSLPIRHIIASFLSGYVVPRLYSIANRKANGSAIDAIDRELARSGTNGRLHISRVADGLRHLLSSSSSSKDSSGQTFLDVCVLLTSQKSSLTLCRLIVSDLCVRLRDRIDFNTTDEAALMREEEQLVRLRSRQLF